MRQCVPGGRAHGREDLEHRAELLNEEVEDEAQDESEEEFVVALADALVGEDAVVVEGLHAPVTLLAVFRAPQHVLAAVLAVADEARLQVTALGCGYNRAGMSCKAPSK